MSKQFLLIAGDHYYPCSGTHDWIACYTTYEEALEQVEKLEDYEFGLLRFKIGSMKYDWFEIVDLKHWTETTGN